MKIFFKGFNFSQDGPGNRLVYHLQGCNMSCPWCSNPEGMPFSGGCELTVDEIIKESKSCVPMFFSGGGVTFTGGEATMQENELTAALKGLLAEGIHTALETNGSSPQLFEIQKYVDYLIMDFKHYDPDAFLYYTGAEFRYLTENFEHLQKIERQLHIRIPLINKINTDEPKKFAEYFSKFKNENTVYEFLPYHEYGKEKWKKEYGIKDGFISQDKLDEFVEIFKSYGLKTINT